MINDARLRSAFEAGQGWDDYLEQSPQHADAWISMRQQVVLSESQQTLLSGFSRSMRVLMVSGTWCGDCVRQGPIIAEIADACPAMETRFIDRDADMSPVDLLEINAGQRVPVTVFMAEDGAAVSTFGDRTLSYYRWMAAQQLGPACPVPGAPIPSDVLSSMTQDWVDECERVQLLLRLSSRLRSKHGD